jgi:hypothetical protein
MTLNDEFVTDSDCTSYNLCFCIGNIGYLYQLQRFVNAWDLHSYFCRSSCYSRLSMRQYSHTGSNKLAGMGGSDLSYGSW